MESRPSYPHSVGYNQPTACWETESKSSNQHKEDKMSLSKRRGNVPVLNNVRGMSQGPKQKKTQTDKDTKDHQGPPAVSRSNYIHIPTAKHTAASLSTVTTATTVTSPATVSSVDTHAMAVMTEALAKEVVGSPMGLSMSCQTVLTAGPSDYSLTSSSSSRARELNSPGNSPQNHPKTTTGHTGVSTGVPKSPPNMAAVTSGGRADTAGAVKGHQEQSKLQEGTQDSTDKETETESKDGEDTLQGIRVGGLYKGSDLTLQAVSQSPSSPSNRKHLSLGATAPSASCLKGTTRETDTNSRRRDRGAETEGRGSQGRTPEDRSQEPAEEERRGEERIEQEMQEQRKEREKAGKDEEERKWDERERENEDRRRSAEGTGRQREEVERQEGVREQKDGQREAGPTRGSYTASAAPAGNSTFVRVVDAGSQTEPSYVSSAVQAVVEVSSKSTATSPTLTPRPQSWLDPELDLPPDLSFHVRASGTRYVSLKNELGPKVNPDSVCRSSHASATKARTKCPSYKSPHQNVCHIEIELCNKSSLSKGPPLQSSVCEADPAGHVRVALPGATEIDSKSSLTQSDPELKQEAKSGDQTETRPPPGVVREEQAETGPPPGVVWDEQGMTWEVYGAAVDMESLGFAIQNHLQRRIQEHVRHIGALRKSISLSEHSALAGKKKKRRNVFRALFHTPACCSRTTAEMVQ